MDSSVFYNRKNETGQIMSYIDPPADNNKILVLVGKTGVGKSGLIKMILSTKLNHRLSVQVSVSKSSPDTIDNLHYLNAMYRTLTQLASQHIFDGIPSPQQNSVMNIKNLFRFGMRVFWSKTAGSENRLYEPIDESSVLRKKDYIVSLLQRQSYIIDIENIQNIDSQSFEIIREILRQVNHTTLILEYTISETHSLEQFFSFYNELRTFNAEVLPFKIEKLDFEEAKKLAPQDIPESQLMTVYQQSEGNLVKMLLSSSIMDENADPIQFKLSLLSTSEQFIINLIYLNGGTIEAALLSRLLLESNPALPFSQSLIEEYLQKLQLEKIIKYGTDGHFHIFHDSIIVELEIQTANAVLFTAFHVLKEFYLGRLREYPSEETIEQLFQLFLKFSDEDVLLIFPHIRQLVMSYKYRHPMITKLTHFREMLTQKGTTNYKTIYELSLSMTRLCVELGFEQEAQKNIGLVYSENNAYHRVLQTAIYTLDFANDQSMEKAEALLTKAVSYREQLIMELFLLSGKMARLPTADSLKIVKRLIETPNYRELFEYAYLLRNYAELTPDYDESIRLYGNVLRRFQIAGRQDLCDQILVSMSMVLAYKGNLIAARYLLTKVQKNRSVPERFILNNVAVLDILEGKFCDRTATALNDALLITGDPYENLIIRSNLLVCYTLLNDKQHAALICETFNEEEYSCFRYEEFLHIIYQNLYFYHQSFGNLSAAEGFKHKIQTLMQQLSPDSMACRIAALQLSGVYSQEEFYSQFQFRVDFLGNWDLEISRDLERSQ